jgi:hypothetical protein
LLIVHVTGSDLQLFDQHQSVSTGQDEQNQFSVFFLAPAEAKLFKKTKIAKISFKMHIIPAKIKIFAKFQR